MPTNLDGADVKPSKKGLVYAGISFALSRGVGPVMVVRSLRNCLGGWALLIQDRTEDVFTIVTVERIIFRLEQVARWDNLVVPCSS